MGVVSILTMVDKQTYNNKPTTWNKTWLTHPPGVCLWLSLPGSQVPDTGAMRISHQSDSRYSSVLAGGENSPGEDSDLFDQQGGGYTLMFSLVD